MPTKKNETKAAAIEAPETTEPTTESTPNIEVPSAADTSWKIKPTRDDGKKVTHSDLTKARGPAFEAAQPLVYQDALAAMRRLVASGGDRYVAQWVVTEALRTTRPTPLIVNDAKPLPEGVTMGTEITVADVKGVHYSGSFLTVTKDGRAKILCGASLKAGWFIQLGAKADSNPTTK